MSKVQTIYSLKELHNLLEKHDNKDQIVVFFDLDLCIVQPHPDDDAIDILIEPEVTKQLFDHIKENNIYFSFVTARFYDSVCNNKKRNLEDMNENVFGTLYPVFEQLGLDFEEFKEDDTFHHLKNHNGTTVGGIYRGIMFGHKKGEIIKHFKKQYGLDETHPITVFVDDYEPYIKNVRKHVPDAIILKREIGSTK